MWAMAGVVATVMADSEPSPQDTNDIRILTVAQAEELAKLPGAIFLNGLTTLTPDAADALAEHEGGLSLATCEAL
jgi:hypothetical protein